MGNFYCRFLPNCAQVLHPLTYLLKGGPQTLQWTVTAHESCQKVKQLLAVAVPLQHPSPTAELSLATDASDTHIGGVMQKKSGNHWRSLGFFSRKLTDTEFHYSTFDRELLAAHAAIKHFRHFCEGRQSQLWIDHKPLVSALTRVSVPISPRQQRQLAFISEFNIQMLYLPGLKNVVAYFLSRPSPPEPTETVTRGSGSRSSPHQSRLKPSPAAAAADPVDFEAMAAEQNSCAETQRFLGGTSLKLAFCQVGAHHLAGDVSTGIFRPIVPQKFRQDIFLNLHNISHPGRLASLRLVSSRFVWCRLSSDIMAWTRFCLCCQQGKIHCHVLLQPLPIPIPQRCFSHIHIDLVGTLQSSNNCSHILTVIDRTSKWMEAIPLVETSVAACAKALIFSWISRFGVPEMITSECGPQYTSNLWSQLCSMLNIAHRQTIAYHPELNGAVERLHRCLKDALRTRAATATWVDELPFVLLRLRAQPRRDTGLSPAESVYGAPFV